MTFESDLDVILDAQSDLAFIVTQDGLIERLNSRARAFLEGSSAGKNIVDLSDQPRGIRTFLSRCSGTNQTMISAVSLQAAPGAAPTRFRTYGTLLSRPKETQQRRIFLRCVGAEDERFSVLAQKVRELNAEVRKRKHIQAVLEETLAEKELLVREIHHRVKNNIHMLWSMLSMAQKETSSSEARSVLGDASRRVSSIAAIQQVLFESESFKRSKASDLIASLITHIRQTVPEGTRISVEVDDTVIPTERALPLTLIVNELLINAIKHGKPLPGEEHASIRFHSEAGRAELRVGNPGRSFDKTDTGRRSSGMGLIRGLARQLGGSFEVEIGSQIVCIVRFVNTAEGGQLP